MMKFGFLACALSVACMAGGPAAAAQADIVPSRDALAVAKAIADRPNVVVSASFVAVPPLGNPVAISDVPLGEFPTSGPSYAILNTGDSTLAPSPNAAPNSGVANSPPGTPPYRGVNDATVLRIDLDVPQNTSCLSLRFRFYSEEFPEYIFYEFLNRVSAWILNQIEKSLFE